MSNDRKCAKDNAWKEFSLYVRARDAYEFSGGRVGRCCTCGAFHDYKDADAGHFIPGRYDSILFEETCVHLQCKKCNRFRQGMWVEYDDFMVREYGQGEVDRLKSLRLNPKKYSIPELRTMAREFHKLRVEIEEKMEE